VIWCNLRRDVFNAIRVVADARVPSLPGRVMWLRDLHNTVCGFFTHHVNQFPDLLLIDRDHFVIKNASSPRNSKRSTFQACRQSDP